MDNFSKRFKLICYLSVISGIYVPGLKILPLKLSRYNSVVMLAYCTLTALCSFINIGDIIAVAVIKGKDPKAEVLEVLYQVSLVIACVWIVHIKFYLIYKRQLISKLIAFWNNLPRKYLWPSKWENLLDTERAKCNKKTWLLLFFFVAPYLINIPNSMIHGVLLTPSSLGKGDELIDADGNFIFILFQSLAYFYQIFCYAMNASLYWTFLTLAKIELEYLEHFIKNTIDDAGCRQNQVNLIDTIADDDTDHLIEQRLHLFAVYHIQIYKFVKKIESAYILLIVLEFVSLTSTMCMVGYCAIEGIINMNLILITISTMISFSTITLMSCLLGDDLHTLGYRVFYNLFHWNWTSQSIKIQKLLLTMIMMARKPIIISASGRFPLNSAAFLKMVLFQYKFFRFIADMMRHRQDIHQH